MKAKFYRKTTGAGIYEEFGVEIWDGESLVCRIQATDEESAHSMLENINHNTL